MKMDPQLINVIAEILNSSNIGWTIFYLFTVILANARPCLKYKGELYTLMSWGQKCPHVHPG